MTTLHLKRRLSRRFSALGLMLSFGLIFGASGIIRLDAAEHMGTPTDIEDVICEHKAAASHGAERLATPPPVLSEGHQDDERSL